MPEEPIHSIDIPQDGTAGAAFLGTARLQKLEKSQDEALEACARIIKIKNEQITVLEENVRVLYTALEMLHSDAAEEVQPATVDHYVTAAAARRKAAR
jgi:hypothetical protein